VAGVETASDAALLFDRHCWEDWMVMGEEDGGWAWMLEVGLALWDGRCGMGARGKRDRGGSPRSWHEFEVKPHKEHTLTISIFLSLKCKVDSRFPTSP